jgi:hypothetical protein
MLSRVFSVVRSLPILFARDPTHSAQEVAAVRNIASYHPRIPKFVALVRSYLYGKSDKTEPIPMVDSVLSSYYLEQTKFIASLNEAGYYKFQFPLKTEYVKKIKEQINKLPVRSRATDAISITMGEVLKPSGVYDYQEDQLLSLSILQEYTTNPIFHKLAASYFGCSTVLDEVCAWWTFPNNSVNQADLNAQLFHSDRRRLFFLKFFLYLEDVDSSNGPHVVIPGSHKSRHSKLRGDGRYSDEETEKYAPNEAVELNGPAGTLIAVDTQALHKGKVLESGKRLILQLHFSTDFLGPPPSTALLGPWDNETLARIKQHPYVFQRLEI